MKKSLNTKINFYIDYCENIKKMTPKSIKNKRNSLENFARFIGNKNIETISNTNFNEWIRFLNDKGISKNSMNDYISRTVSMFKFYQDMGERLELKIPMIPRFDGEPRRKNYYSKEVIDYVISQSDDVSGLMIRIGFDTGMRLSELTNLRLSDFDEKKVHYMGKGRRWHDSWLREETYRKLLDYIRDYAINDYLWVEKDGSHLSDQTVAKYMKKSFEKCGYYDFHTHALRHSFATNLQKRGASVEEIQHMIGHLHLATTEEYLHGFDKSTVCGLFEKYA